MSYSKIKRRALILAIVTMACVITVILGYWHAVNKGVLPSPVQPVLGHTPVVPPKPVAVRARPSASPPSKPSEAGPHPAPSVAFPQIEVGSLHPETAARSAPMASPSPGKISTTPHSVEASRAAPTPVVVAAAAPEKVPHTPSPKQTASVVDQKTAEHWLSSTNDRPVVKVRYKADDILRLGELGRGVIVVSGKHKQGPRELYLRSSSSASPLFAPYTRTIADQFSSYSLVLEDDPALDRLAAVLPVYFSEPAVILTFVPDYRLATQIFAQVAHASRSMADPLPGSAQLVFEGQLTLDGTQPNFVVLDVRRGT